MITSPTARTARLRRGAAAGARPPGAPPRGDFERAAFDKPDARARVLIVEDDFVVAMEMETALKAAGFEVAGIAGTARDAVWLALQTRPDLAVMDIRLQGERDGVDAAIEIYRAAGVRAIFATAHQDPPVQARAEAARPLGWLTKPYDSDALISLVRTAAAALKS
jgi:DNA-binding NarL/FixJ family response regulator